MKFKFRYRKNSKVKDLCTHKIWKKNVYIQYQKIFAQVNFNSNLKAQCLIEWFFSIWIFDGFCHKNSVNELELIWNLFLKKLNYQNPNAKSMLNRKMLSLHIKLKIVFHTMEKLRKVSRKVLKTKIHPSKNRSKFQCYWKSRGENS